MRITRWAAAASAAALVLGLAACGGGEETGGGTGTSTAKTFPAGSTMETLNKAQKIRVGTKFDQPGFGLKGLSGKPEGFDVEIAKIIAEELGIPDDKIEYTETPSSVREQVIVDGKVDIVAATYTINAKRKETISFAGPYYIAGQTLLVKADDATITGPEAFKAGDKKVCSVTGSTPATKIQEYLANKDTQLVLFDVYQKCVDALAGGQVNAVTTDNVILSGFVAKNEGKFKLSGAPFTEEPYGIGLKKDDKVFRDWINDVLTKAFTDGRYAQAWKDTAGKFDPNLPKTPTVVKY
jgi:glutamate transport system substrate-binding protein